MEKHVKYGSFLSFYDTCIAVLSKRQVTSTSAHKAQTITFLNWKVFGVNNMKHINT